MKSFWKRRNSVLAVGLTAVVAGALWGFQPALAGSTADGPWAKSIFCFSPDYSAQGALDLSPDGAATATVGVFLGPTVILGVAFAPAPDGEVSVDIQSGQSGNGSGSGAGHFTINDVYAFNFATFQYVGPYDVSVDLSVENATDLSATTIQGITTQFNPFTGETTIVRQHSIGNNAMGMAAGSLSIYVDFRDGYGFVPVNETSGGLGSVKKSIVRSHERIH